MSGVYFARHGWAGSALLGAAFLLALGHAGPGVRACKVSLKVEKHAPSGEPGLLGSGEAALPVWGRGDLYRAPGLFFSLESRWWRCAPRAPRLGLDSGPGSHSSSRGGLDSQPRGAGSGTPPCPECYSAPRSWRPALPRLKLGGAEVERSSGSAIRPEARAPGRGFQSARSVFSAPGAPQSAWTSEPGLRRLDTLTSEGFRSKLSAIPERRLQSRQRTASLLHPLSSPPPSLSTPRVSLPWFLPRRRLEQLPLASNSTLHGRATGARAPG